jgi:hypothetical protein
MPMFIPLVVAVAFDLGVVAIIGGALSAVGGLVGSKELSLVGSLMSLGGGLAGAASGAAGAGEAAAGVAAEGASEAAANVSDIVARAPEATVAGTDVAGATIQAVNEGGQAVNLQPPAATIETTAGVPGQGPGLLSGGAAGTGIAGDASRYLSGDLGAGTAAASDAGVFAKDPAMARIAGGVSGERPGLLAQANNWLKDNKEIANIGGGFIKGAGEAYFKQRSNKELVELQRQRNLTAADQQALQRELAARGIANLNYVPKSTGMSVNPNASLYPTGKGPADRRFQSLLSGA